MRKHFPCHLSPKLHWRRLISGGWRCRVGKHGEQANCGPGSGVSYDRFVSRRSDTNHKPQMESAVLSVNVLVWRGSWLCCLFLHLSPRTLVCTSLALFTPPPAMRAKFGKGWSLSGSFRIRSKTPRLKPPFLFFPAVVRSCKKPWSCLKKWGANYPSLLPVWAGSHACGQFHVSLSLICGWSCLIILGWFYDYNSIRSFADAAIEPPF